MTISAAQIVLRIHTHRSKRDWPIYVNRKYAWEEMSIRFPLISIKSGFNCESIVLFAFKKMCISAHNKLYKEKKQIM